MKLVKAKCPSCGSNLELNQEDEKVKCKYCESTIIVDDAIACYKVKVTVKGNVNIDGIETNSDLIEAANELLDMGEYLKAKKKFLEFSEKCPENYQGWLGLLICRTRNFKIRDNNILFENDIKKYYEHFIRTAPESVKNDYLETIEDYMFPDRIKEKIIEEVKEETNEKTEQYKTQEKSKNEKIELDKTKEENKKEKVITEKKKTDSKVKNIIISIIFYIIALFSLLFMAVSDSIILKILWLLTCLIFIPPLYKMLSKKIDLFDKHGKIIRIVLPIVSFIALIIFTEPIFADVWVAGDKTYVDLSDRKCVYGNYKIVGSIIEYDSEYSAEYISSYDGNDGKSIYTIDCGNKYKFRYDEGNLCLLENDTCVVNYVKISAKDELDKE